MRMSKLFFLLLVLDPFTLRASMLLPMWSMIIRILSFFLNILSTLQLTFVRLFMYLVQFSILSSFSWKSTDHFTKKRLCWISIKCEWLIKTNCLLELFFSVFFSRKILEFTSHSIQFSLISLHYLHRLFSYMFYLLLKTCVIIMTIKCWGKMQFNIDQGLQLFLVIYEQL